MKHISESTSLCHFLAMSFNCGLFWKCLLVHVSPLQISLWAVNIGQILVSTTEHVQGTVNWEIFARVLFMRNFAYAKFHANKIIAKWRKHSVVY